MPAGQSSCIRTFIFSRPRFSASMASFHLLASGPAKASCTVMLVSASIHCAKLFSSSSESSSMSCVNLFISLVPEGILCGSNWTLFLVLLRSTDPVLPTCSGACLEFVLTSSFCSFPVSSIFTRDSVALDILCGLGMSLPSKTEWDCCVLARLPSLSSMAVSSSIIGAASSMPGPGEVQCPVLVRSNALGVLS